MSAYVLPNNIPLATTGYNVNSGIGGVQPTQSVGGSIMGVGGGIGDNAADVTYSTKPNAQGQAVNLQGNAYATSSFEYGQGLSQTAGAGAIMTGNTMSTTTGGVMGFGAGGDNAIDVTYSTKADAQNVGLVNTGVSQITNTGITGVTGVEGVTTTTTTTQNAMATTGNVMGFGAGGDSAIDVTYSTKADNQNAALINTGLAATTTTTTTQNTVTTSGNVMGFGAGGDSAIDVTYSTKPDTM